MFCIANDLTITFVDKNNWLYIKKRTADGVGAIAKIYRWLTISRQNQWRIIMNADV